MKKIITVILVLLLCFSAFAYTTDELLKAMVGNNTEILKAREELKQSLLDVSDAKAGYYPSVDLTLTGSYIANPIDPIRINLSDYIPGMSTSEYVKIYDGQESLYYQFKLQLTQPVFTSGKLSNGVKLASLAAEARELQLQRTTENEEVQLRANCAALYYLQMLKEVVSELQAYSSRLVELSQSACENGMMLETDFYNIKAKARSADSALSQVESKLLSTEASVARLSGIMDFSFKELEFDEKEVLSLCSRISSSDYTELKSSSVSSERTVFTLLDKMNEIAKASEDFANASVSWKPDVAIVVDASYSGSRFPLIETDWYRKDDWAATITVAVKTTLFDAGTSARAVDRAVSSSVVSAVDKSAAENEVLSTLAENYGNFISSVSDIEYRKVLLESLESQSRSRLEQFESGYGSESDYIQSLIDLKSCESELIQAYIERAVSAYTIGYLCGMND